VLLALDRLGVKGFFILEYKRLSLFPIFLFWFLLCSINQPFIRHRHHLKEQLVLILGSSSLDRHQVVWLQRLSGARNRRHWSINDPTAVTGRAHERLVAFRSTRDALRKRIEAELLLAL
jgi:hypothetical protein